LKTGGGKGKVGLNRSILQQKARMRITKMLAKAKRKGWGGTKRYVLDSKRIRRRRASGKRQLLRPFRGMG
jgi:hypothetical protein